MSPTMHTSRLMRTVPQPGASWRRASRPTPPRCAGRPARSRPERAAERPPNAFAFLCALRRGPRERRGRRLLGSSVQRSRFGRCSRIREQSICLRHGARDPYRGRSSSSLHPLVLRVAGPAPLVILGRVAWTVTLILVRPVDGRLAKRSGEVAGAGDFEVVHEGAGVTHAVRPVIVLFQRNFFQALAVGSSRPYVALNLVQRAGGLVDSSQAFVAADAGILKDEQAGLAVALDNHALLDVLDALADGLERECGIDAPALERRTALCVVVGDGGLDWVVLIQLRDAGSMVLDQDLGLIELPLKIHGAVVVDSPPLPDERIGEPEVDRADPVNDRRHLRAGDNVGCSVEFPIYGAFGRNPKTLEISRSANPGQRIQRRKRPLALHSDLAGLIVQSRVVSVVRFQEADRWPGFDPVFGARRITVCEKLGALCNSAAASSSGRQEFPVA